MKLLRYGEIGKEKPGILDQEGKIRDLSNHISDINGDNISKENLNKISSIDVSSLPIIPDNTRLGACVGNIGKFLCIGLNYSDHAAETGMPVPSEPILFSKATSAVVGPNDNIEIPRNSLETDWEVELGIIIGKKAKYINEDDAEEYIAGYCVVNDVSEREFQLKKDNFLDFLTIETKLMPDNNYEMKIVFAGDSVIKILSEVSSLMRFLIARSQPFEALI